MVYTVCTVYEMVFTEHPDFIYYPLCLQLKRILKTYVAILNALVPCDQVFFVRL